MPEQERVLLVGGGGREHAIAAALADDCELHACSSNRNPGITRLASAFHAVAGTDVDGVVEVAEAVDIDLAVIGPEAPLAAGVVDALAEAGVYAFGPPRAAARIETDKVWARQFMREHDVPGCPEFETFASSEAAAEHVAGLDHDVAVKPRGLTGGKGVRVTGDQLTRAEAADYVRASDHEEWVIEERLVGEEFTVQAFVAGGDVVATPAVQDHKRAYERDEGPNTGGMGSYSDTGRELPFVTAADYEAAVGTLEATVDALAAAGHDYRGVLYGQFMLTGDGLCVVEFNARFGDPEATNTLPTLETSPIDVLRAARDGRPLPDVVADGRATVCKYAVPEGYPTAPEAGTRLDVDPDAGLSEADARPFFASVDEREDGLFTTTSRALAVVGFGDSIAAAEAAAERGLSEVGAAGLRVRHDVGTEASVRERVEHARELRGEPTESP
ncbi:phosphoribosylamine--glycine ligase [Halobacteriales archaeon SW_5_70_135]|nr:MAG: phosphoribosylamine--glycine ligase [Halobacteriales archaeon SW_5_70_135]